MSWVIGAYCVVAAWVFYLKYTDTPEEHRAKVRDHWLRYYAKCLAWPLMLVDRSKGF